MISTDDRIKLFEESEDHAALDEDHHKLWK
jgi:hypothetical protein